MNWLQIRKSLVARGYWAPAGDDGASGGGGGGGDDDANKSDDDKGGNPPNDDKSDDDKGGKPDDDKSKKGGMSDADAKLLKENMKQKEALKKAAADKAAAEQSLAELKAQLEGLDLEELKKLAANKKAAEEADLMAKGEWDRLKQRMAEEHQKQLAGKEVEAKTYAEQLAKAKQTIAELSVGSMFNGSRFIAEELTLTPNKARVVYGDYFDVADDGTVTGYDKPRGRENRTALVDGSGDPLPFEEALKRIVEADPDKDYLIRSKLKPGAGSNNSGRGGPSSSQNLTPQEKIAKGLSKLKIATGVAE